MPSPAELHTYSDLTRARTDERDHKCPECVRLSSHSASRLCNAAKSEEKARWHPGCSLIGYPSHELEEQVAKVPIVAMLIAAGMALPAPAQSQVSVQVNIGQPPPVVVAQPVLVPVQASPVYYAPSYGPDLFFYDGRYYTVRNDQWFYAARLNTPWVAIAIGKVPQHILAVPVAYYRVPPGHLKHKGGHCPPGQAKKGRC